MGAHHKTILAILAISVAFLNLTGTVASPVENEHLVQKRSILDYISSWFGPNCGGPNSCPVHHCQTDPAVNLGYCCGCAKLFDSAPIHCHPDMQCPLDGHRLCADYNYMMDCCC